MRMIWREMKDLPKFRILTSNRYWKPLTFIQSTTTGSFSRISNGLFTPGVQASFKTRSFSACVQLLRSSPVRTVFCILLSLCNIAGPGRGEPEPRIELPPNDTLEVLDPAVVLSDASILVSGRVKRLLPWADTSWDHVVISLYDENGELIIEINTDYSPFLI